MFGYVLGWDVRSRDTTGPRMLSVGVLDVGLPMRIPLHIDAVEGVAKLLAIDPGMDENGVPDADPEVPG